MVLSKNAVDPDKYENAKEGVLDLILEESDKRVGAQVQLMLAADSRASGILSGCVALAAAGVGFAVSQLADPSPLFWASLAFGAWEAVGACMALWSLWPEGVRPQGWAPVTFETDLGKTKVRVQAEMAAFLQDRIEKNRITADRLANRVKAAMLFAATGPIAGLVASLFAARMTGWAVVAGVICLIVVLRLGIPLIPGFKAHASPSD